MKDTLDIQAVAVAPVDKITGRLWLVFGICFVGNIFGGTISTLMSVYLPVVVRDLLGEVDPERLNFVSASINSLYILGWMAGGFTWGWIADKMGRSRSLFLAIACYSAFAVLTSLAMSWEMVIVFRFFSGFGVGGVLVVSVALLSEILPEKSKAILIGILSIGFPVGIFSAGAVNYLIPDWRQGFMFGFIPMALAVFSFWGLVESEKWKSDKLQKVTKPSIFNEENRPNLIKGSVIFGSMLIGLWGIFSWIPTWVQSLLVDSSGQQERGLSMMLLGGGGLTGGFFSGWISNRIGVRKAMIICFSACIVLCVLLFAVNKTFSPIIYLEIGALALFFGASQGLLAVYVPPLFPTSIRATATGFCFNIGRLFTAIAVFFVGAMVSTLGGYGNSLLMFSFIFLFGLVTIYLNKEN